MPSMESTQRAHPLHEDVIMRSRVPDASPALPRTRSQGTDDVGLGCAELGEVPTFGVHVG